MTRKTIMLMSAAIAVAGAYGAALALPTVKVTTSNGQEPPAGTLISGSTVGNSPAYNFNYVRMSKFEITGAGALQDFSQSEPGDSIRQRGNSTANVDMPKKPYRIKFDKKISLFGKEPAKSWVLLANHMDKTFAMTALAFRLGHILGLEFTNTSQFVNLEICNPSGACTYKGIYQLTEQIQVNPGRVDIDDEKGWLAEFNFHNPDANDIMFTTGSSRYSLSVFIKSPEIDDADYRGSSVSSYPSLTFVRDEFNAILDTLASSSKFSAGAHRNYIDLTSFAKFIFIQQFMANFEWTQLGYLGSNFVYKDFGGKLKAGPIWDFDLATGTLGSNSHYTFFASASSSARIEPPSTSTMGSTRNAFYRRLLEDEVFRARYRKIWEDNKAQIQALAAPGGFIDSIANVLKNDIVKNYEPYKDFRASSTFGNNCFVGCGVTGSGPSTVALYEAEITKLKTWWNNRYTHWNTTISNSANNTRFDASKDIPDAMTSAPARARPATAVRVSAAKNGVTLNVVDKASVQVYGLDGRQLRNVSLTRGNHSVRFGDMPKGMYVVRAAVDGEVRTLRVPVR